MTDSEIFNHVRHRPTPLPEGKWIMQQEWNHLLFLHWPVDVQLLRKHVPDELTLDLYEGQGWISISPFLVTNQRFRLLPPLPTITNYPEINCRTYVIENGIPAIYFFSLDIGSLLSVAGARIFAALPYYYSKVDFKTVLNEHSFELERNKRVRFKVAYSFDGPAYHPVKHTLEHFLVNRFCLFQQINHETHKVEIHHLPWPLHKATARIYENSLPPFDIPGFHLPPPVLSYTRFLKVFFWPVKPLHQKAL